MSNVIAFNSNNTILPASVLSGVYQQPVVSTPSPTKDYKGETKELFTVDSFLIQGPYGDIQGKKGLFVGEENINIVSDRYEVHQPMEFLEMFQNLADNHGLSINRVLPNPKNGGLLLSAKYQDVQILGEDHDVNLTFYTSHCGKYTTMLTMDLLRIACFNQVPALFRNKSRHLVREKHYQNALDIQLVGDLIQYLPESIENYQEKAEILSNKSLSFNDFMDLFVDHYKLDKQSKQFQTKVNAMKDTYYNAVGQRGLSDTAYKAFQAITFNNTHNVRNTAMKEENRWIKGGNDSLSFQDKLLAA